jgi:hypothetical protein
VAAFEMALLVGLALADLLRGVGEASFGHRQVAAGAMAVVLVVGLGGQAVQAAMGSWAIGGADRVEPAYVLVDQASTTRVLWIGDPSGDAFAAPGGLPDGIVDAGPASVRYAVRGPSGATALDTGRPATGPGYGALESALSQILAGDVHHGGALLAPFGIHFVIARAGDLSQAAYRRLARQVDLDQVPSRGLTIFVDEKAPPVAGVIPSIEWRRMAESSDPEAIAMLPEPGAKALTAENDQAFTGGATGGPSLVYLAQQFDARWKLTADTPEEVQPIKAFGWAVGFRVGADPGGLRVSFGGQRSRTIEVGLLVLLWAAALWLTRRPARNG